MSNTENDGDLVGSYLVACWRIEGHAVAMRAEQVLEVVEIEELTSLPCEDPRLLGLASLRGGLLPIFSLAREIGLNERHQSLWPPFPAVIVSIEGSQVGVPADSLPQIERATVELPAHGSLVILGDEPRIVLESSAIRADHTLESTQEMA